MKPAPRRRLISCAPPPTIPLDETAPDHAVHPQTLKARLDAGEALVDVRETWDYSLAHIPGAINFPLGELADCAMELDAEDVKFKGAVPP